MTRRRNMLYTAFVPPPQQQQPIVVVAPPATSMHGVAIDNRGYDNGYGYNNGNGYNNNHGYGGQYQYQDQQQQYYGPGQRMYPGQGQPPLQQQGMQPMDRVEMLLQSRRCGRRGGGPIGLAVGLVRAGLDARSAHQRETGRGSSYRDVNEPMPIQHQQQRGVIASSSRDLGPDVYAHRGVHDAEEEEEEEENEVEKAGWVDERSHRFGQDEKATLPSYQDAVGGVGRGTRR